MKKTSIKTKKERLIFSSASFILIAIIALLFSGCSVIGWFYGKSTKRYKTEVQISGWEINKIDKIQELKLILRNSDTIVGKNLHNEFIPENEYAQLYNVAYERLFGEVKIPKIGDTIRISSRTNNFNSDQYLENLTFAGFDYNSIYLNGNNQIKPYSFISLKNPQIKSGSKLDFQHIQQLLQTGEIPLKILRVIETNSGLKRLNPNEIQYVSYTIPEKKYAKEGFLIGLGADILVLSIALVSANNPPQQQSVFRNDFIGGSCPYIYSYDGKNYHLDSETFGGSIFKAAQRTDVDNLDYLKEHKGYYQLRLTNELDETQYVDEFKLLIADHPKGTQVIPSFDGKLHVLNTLKSPERATDKDGNNVLHLIKSKDDNVWISNPFTRNPEIPGDGRDAMEVIFDKPLHAETVKLAFNVQNTLWAASLQRDMLALHGNKLQDWYALMNTSEPARNAFTKAMIREGMLLVQVWNGTNWQTKDYVWEVGPMIPKDQVVVLDLKDISGDKLKIRLESTVGFWMINSIGADYSEEMTADIHELTAESAIDQTGKNVTEILRNNDGQYLVMPTTKDKVDITFKVIPQKKNATRTYLLKCSGYYNIHTNETGEPKLALLDKLITEPGAYGQFVLKKLNKELAAWEQ